MVAFERGTAFIESQMRLGVTVERLLSFARNTRDCRGRALIEDNGVAAQLGRLRARAAGLRAMSYHNAERSRTQSVPGPEGTYVALMLSELKQQVYRLWLEMLGSDGLERRDLDCDVALPESLTGSRAHAPLHPVEQYLFSFAGTIGGGTSEIRRNIIAERILRLPRHDATGESVA